MNTRRRRQPTRSSLNNARNASPTNRMRQGLRRSPTARRRRPRPNHYNRSTSRFKITTPPYQVTNSHPRRSTRRKPPGDRQSRRHQSMDSIRSRAPRRRITHFTNSKARMHQSHRTNRSDRGLNRQLTTSRPPRRSSSSNPRHDSRHKLRSTTIRRMSDRRRSNKRAQIRRPPPPASNTLR